MAEHKSQHGDRKVVVVMSSKGQLLRGVLLRNWKIILPIIVVGVIGIAVGVLMYKHPWQKQKQAPAVKTPIQRSSEAYQKGDYNASLRELQDAEKQATANTEKVKVYDSMAAAFLVQGKFTEGLHYYDLKHQLDPNSTKEDAKILATTYMRMGDKVKALEQYKIALEYYKAQPQTDTAQNDAAYIQAQIQDLGQSK